MSLGNYDVERWLAWYQGWAVTKGGPGSGHRGHAGRSGKHGGSMPKAFGPSGVGEAMGYELTESSYGDRPLSVSAVYRSARDLDSVGKVTEGGAEFLGNVDPRGGIFTARDDRVAGFYGGLQAIKDGTATYDEWTGEWTIKGELPGVYGISTEGIMRWERWSLKSGVNPFVGVSGGRNDEFILKQYLPKGVAQEIRKVDEGDLDAARAFLQEMGQT